MGRRAECQDGQMTALSSRVPRYTTNLTTPEVAAMPKLSGGAGCLR